MKISNKQVGWKIYVLLSLLPVSIIAALSAVSLTPRATYNQLLTLITPTPLPRYPSVTPTPRPLYPSVTPLPTNYPTPIPNPTGSITSYFDQPLELLKNGSFEIDTNGDMRPDSWSTNSHVTRSSSAYFGGKYSIKHYATDNSSYTITQTINNIQQNRKYFMKGYVNIPTSSDSFEYRVEVRWRDQANNILRTDTIKSFTSTTNGSWNYFGSVIFSTENSSNAQIIMRVKDLKATIYADDFSFVSQ